ncbi:MarR family winged helix-turn-helix transcriptional regulator [Rhodopseudomonas sp. P2A-2r]|uniref:MarR family winged helix-turn-helix transcriptional regulator n=1 Tax=Rhodopseudomonas sp. P2A-2r TaxID=2991972 RepID=UPI00223421AC|nr:MarR family winged helix-turn-helix transcriptional regulator [Rhodopseudomonas sp. P2A-2r]UZE51288.1 MarR family winged helix-turn-helix transcriptional regulator [Rhodopseudomonas sp. P2A-2r]
MFTPEPYSFITKVYYRGETATVKFGDTPDGGLPIQLVCDSVARYTDNNADGNRMASKVRQRKVKVEPTISRQQLMVDGSDAGFRQFLHDTLAFSARLQAVRAQLGAAIGLSGTQYTVLIAIAHLSGGDEKVGVNQIAAHLHFSGAFITIEIKKLVTNGLVEKETDAADRRRVVLTISPKARALLNELATVQRPVNDMLFRSLTVSDFDRFRKLMSAMVEDADEAIRLIDYKLVQQKSAK